MKALALMLSPFAPHMAEELWERLGETSLVAVEAWPKFDESKTIDAEVVLAVQVNGKLKSTIPMPIDSTEEAVVEAASKDPKIAKLLEEQSIVKTILVPNKLVNLILKPKA
jgi:leucyl-tRNA synthetase